MASTFVVHSYSEDNAVPAEVFKAPVYFIGKTHEELSIVVPDTINLDSEEQEGGWRALEVLGPLGFSMVGILANISGVLAAEKISIFAISTFDTDYILLKQNMIEQGIKALESDGYTVLQA